MTEKQREKFKELLMELEDKKILPHFVLIGSWAELMYEETGLIKEFKPALRTQDLDFLLKDKSKTKKFSKPRDIGSLLISMGYKFNASFPEEFERYEIYHEDFDDELIMFVEFLASETGKEGDNPHKYEQFGIKAQTLRQLSMFRDNTVEVEWEGVKVTVPTPSAYVLQKMFINDQRRTPAKRDKDIASIEYLLEFIKGNPVLMKEMKATFNGYFKKQKAQIRKFCERQKIDLADYMI